MRCGPIHRAATAHQLLVGTAPLYHSCLGFVGVSSAQLIYYTVHTMHDRGARTTGGKPYSAASNQPATKAAFRVLHLLRTVFNPSHLNAVEHGHHIADERERALPFQTFLLEVGVTGCHHRLSNQHVRFQRLHTQERNRNHHALAWRRVVQMPFLRIPLFASLNTPCT